MVFLTNFIQWINNGAVNLSEFGWKQFLTWSYNIYLRAQSYLLDLAQNGLWKEPLSLPIQPVLDSIRWNRHCFTDIDESNTNRRAHCLFRRQTGRGNHFQFNFIFGSATLWETYSYIESNGAENRLLNFHRKYVAHFGHGIQLDFYKFTEIDCAWPAQKQTKDSLIHETVYRAECTAFMTCIYLVTSLTKQIFCSTAGMNETHPRNVPPSVYGVRSACSQSWIRSFSTAIGAASMTWSNVSGSIAVNSVSILSLNFSVMWQNVETIRKYFWSARWLWFWAAFISIFLI